MTRTRTRKRPASQKVSRSLAGFAEAKKASIDLIREIQTHVVSKSAQEDDHREPHKIHVSEIVKDTCIRRLYYKVTEAETTDVEPPAGHRMEMIWAAGNAEHAKWQQWLQEMGLLWGNWICKHCDTVHPNQEQPAMCTECGWDRFTYDEAHLEDALYRLVGHSDGAVPSMETLVEVKSFSAGTVRMENPGLLKEHTHKVDGKTLTDIEGLWRAIKRPLPSHLKQGMFYLWLCQRMGLPFKRIVFIYENKTNQATKSFDVKYSERLIANEIKVLEDVETYAAEGVVPARPALFDKSSKPCNACPFRTMCWETDEEEARGEGAAPSTEVPARRSRTRSRTTGGESEVRPSRPSRRGGAEGTGGHHRSRGSRTGATDDRDDSVGGAPGRATRDGRGGRALGGRGSGQGEGPRFSRRDRG